MTKKILFFSLFFIALLVAVWFRDSGASKASNFNQNITLQVNSAKENYILGETVNLEFTLINKSSKPLRVPSVENGYMHIWIASFDRNFKEYRGSGWGGRDSGKGVKAGETFKSQITLLWNDKPPRPSTITENRLDTNYAFPNAGVYFIKATGSIWDNGQKFTIESEPIQIAIGEPVGDDLIVWKKMEDNIEFGYFMQEGTFLTLETDKKEKLFRNIEQLTTEYPNSLLTSKIMTSLEKFRENEKRRKEFLENLKRRKN